MVKLEPDTECSNLDCIISPLRGSFVAIDIDWFFSLLKTRLLGKKYKLDKQASDGTGSCCSGGGLRVPHPPAVRIGDLGYMQGSLGAPFMVCLPLCLVSSFLFRNRPRVAPFFCLPSGCCCRNTRSLCDWLKPGSFCWCRRRKKSLAPFLRIPSAKGGA